MHLDGYDQTAMLTGKGASNRHEVFYFAERNFGAVRIDDYKYRFIDQPQGWLGPTLHPDMPMITNLRLDPFERLGMPQNGSLTGGWGFPSDFFVHEFWRFVFVQQKVAEAAQTFIEFPPMQKGAGFSIDQVKEQVEAAMRKYQAQ